MTARNGSAGVLVVCRCVEGGSSRRLIRRYHGYHRPIVSTASRSLTASPSLVLVDGDIGKQETAVKAVEVAIKRFETIDVLVNNAGIFRTKPFTEFTTEDFNALVSTNLLGFLYITQLTVKQMLKQKSGSVVTISASLADQPFTGVKASVSMITKGGLNSVTQSLARSRWPLVAARQFNVRVVFHATRGSIDSHPIGES